MAFDLNSAKDAPDPLSQSSTGFDLSSAKEAEDPLKKKKTTFVEDFKIGLANIGNTVDTAASMLFANTELRRLAGLSQDEVFKGLEDRVKSREQFSNPEKKEQGFAGKATSILTTLPSQMLTFPLSPFTTGKTAIDAGESLDKALTATGIDTLGNIAGVGLPGAVGASRSARFASGVGIGGTQDYLTKAAIQSNMETEAGRKAFNPTLEDALLAGLAQGALVSVAKPGVDKRETERERRERILAEQRAIEAQRPKQTEAPFEKTNESQQMELFDQPEMGRMANPYEAKLGDWRVDENGIPIKADLSMEVQNLQDPLQRNLWGDELERTRNPVGVEATLEDGIRQLDDEGQGSGLNLTDAIDTMPQGPDRQMALDLLRPELPASGELQGARAMANSRQRGMVDFQAIVDAFADFGKSLIKKPLFHGTSVDKPFDDFKANPRGIFLTEDPKVASDYAKDNDSQKVVYEDGKYVNKNTASRVMPVYANIQNPYRLSPEEAQQFKYTTNYAKYQREMTVRAKAAGHDAIIYPDGAIAVFSPDQIKSAISPVKSRSARRPGSQGGAIHPDLLFSIATLGMYPALKGLSNRLRSLERVQKLTLEGIRQSVNQQDTPLPEKEMVIRVAQQIADDKGNIDPVKLGTALNNELGNQTLTLKIDPTYATYGLQNIGVKEGTPAATVIFKVPFEISDENHFNEPNYFGHIRMYQPDPNNAFVVEVQSDLAQKLKPVDETELIELQKRKNSINSKFDLLNILDNADIYGPTWEKQRLFFDVIFLLNQKDLTSKIERRLGQALDETRDVEKEDGVYSEPIYDINYWEEFAKNNPSSEKSYRILWILRDELNDYTYNLEGEFGDVSTKIYDLLRQQEAAEKIAPISAALKVWPQRLVRETLAAITRKGGAGKKVHFATADTMAKVEGWMDYHESLRDIGELRQYEESIKVIQDNILYFEEKRQKALAEGQEILAKAFLEDIEQEKITLKKYQDDLNKKLAQHPRFGTNQGIYDRHKKVVESFVRDLGGVDYTDENGNTWITVTTEPQFATPVLYGAKANMKGTQRGAASPEFLFTLATGGLYPIVKKLREGKPNDPNRAAMIPDDPNPQDVLQVARTEKDTTWSIAKNLESGGTNAAMNRRSTAVQAASRWVQNAQKRADYNNRAYVFPLENIARKLSAAELETVSKLVRSEDMASEGFAREVLEKNLTVAQLEAYDSFRQMMDKAYEEQNAALVRAGEKPLTKREFYVSSRWLGDFRQPVMDANGRLVYYLADTTKWGLNKQIAALKAEFPDLVINPKDAHQVTLKKGEDIVTAYRTMKNILGADDPAVARIAQFIEEKVMKETSQTLGQQKHFERKSGVRGAVGDRPGKNPEKEAVEFFRQQVQYAKNAFKWAEMQKAGESIKKVIQDEILIETQPKNVEYIRDYYKTNLGYGEAEFIKALENSIRTLGVSPNSIASGVSAAKSAFILQKLLASPGYIAANFIQSLWVLPYLTMMRGHGYKGNPLKAISVGAPLGIALAKGHWINVLGGDNVLPKGADWDFYRQAFQYAEDNGITSRSSYDESPIGANSSLPAKAVDMTAKFSMAYPETIVRSIAFMSYAQMLKDSGKFKDNIELLQKAEEYVNTSMVDYREGERPMMFAKLGIMGNAFNTLQTFPVSYYNQWRLFIKEAGQGNPVPFVTALALQYALAGVVGLPGAQDLDDMYQAMKKFIANTKPELWAKMKENDFFRDPKMWVLKQGGPGHYAGWLSEWWDVSMTSRVAAPVLGDMATSVVGPAQDAARQIEALGKAVIDPTNDVKWAQSAMLSAPVGLQGLLEQGPLADYTGAQQPEGTRSVFKSTDLAQRKNLYERSPEEQFVRNFGVRSNKEVLTKEANYRTNTDAELSAQAATKIPDSIYNAIRKGNQKDAMEKAQLYFRLTGRPITRAMLEKQFKDEFFTDTERIQNSVRTVEAIKRQKQITELINAIGQ